MKTINQLKANLNALNQPVNILFVEIHPRNGIVVITVHMMIKMKMKIKLLAANKIPIDIGR